MNKRELIKLVAEKLGAANNEVKVAFDIFLQKVAEAAEENSALRIPEIGIFHLKRKDLIRQDQYSLLFLPLKYSPQEKNKILSFDVNVIKQPELTSGESAFDISIGKPLIPITGVNRRDFIVQSSYIMLQKTFEERTDNLLSRSVQLTDLKIDPRLIETDDQNVDEFLDDYSSYETIREEAKEIPWDFGIPTMEPDADETIGREEYPAQSDDSGIITDDDTEIEIPEDEIPDFTGKAGYEEPQNNTDALAEKVSADEDTVLPEEQADTEQNFYKIDIRDISEEEKSPQTEAFFDEDNFINEEAAPEEPLIKEVVSAGDEDSRIKYDEEKYEEEKVSYEYAINSIDSAGESESEGESESDYESSIIEEENDHHSRMDFSVPFEPGKDYVRDDELPPNLKVKFGLWFWVLLAAFVILTSAGIYYFVFNAEESGGQMAKTEAPVEKNVIERDYEIPVTIIPNEDSAGNAAGSGDKQGSENKNIESTEAQKKPLSENKPQISPAVTRPDDNKNILVKEYIFSDGIKFTIQISSWRTRSVAEGEVYRLKNSGFPSYISDFKSKAGQNWYRVRVGEFATLKEAEDFLGKNVNNLFK